MSHVHVHVRTIKGTIHYIKEFSPNTAVFRLPGALKFAQSGKTYGCFMLIWSHMHTLIKQTKKLALYMYCIQALKGHLLQGESLGVIRIEFHGISTAKIFFLLLTQQLQWPSLGLPPTHN